MSDRLKAALNDDKLYDAIISKLGDKKKVDLTEGLLSLDKHNKVRDSLKRAEADRDKFKDDVETYKKAAKDVENLLSENEDLKAKYSDLSATHNKELADRDNIHQGKLKRILVENKLVKSNVSEKYVPVLMNLVKYDGVSIDNDNLIGFDSQLEGFKKDYSEFFIKKTKKSNVPPGKGNADASDSNSTTMESLFGVSVFGE